jgi:hypothetical protein
MNHRRRSGPAVHRALKKVAEPGRRPLARRRAKVAKPMPHSVSSSHPRGQSLLDSVGDWVVGHETSIGGLWDNALGRPSDAAEGAKEVGKISKTVGRLEAFFGDARDAKRSRSYAKKLGQTANVMEKVGQGLTALQVGFDIGVLVTDLRQGKSVGDDVVKTASDAGGFAPGQWGSVIGLAPDAVHLGVDLWKGDYGDAAKDSAAVSKNATKAVVDTTVMDASVAACTVMIPLPLVGSIAGVGVGMVLGFAANCLIDKAYSGFGW